MKKLHEQIRRHILSLGWADARRTRDGKWFCKSSPRYENNYQMVWTSHPIFESDVEAVASMTGEEVPA